MEIIGGVKVRVGLAVALGVLIGLTAATALGDARAESAAVECAPPGHVLAAGPLITADPDNTGYFAVETVTRDQHVWARGPGLTIVAEPKSVPWMTLNGLVGAHVEIVIRSRTRRTAVERIER